MRERLSGTFTAIVTPMNADGSIDYGALDALVDEQLAGGVEGLVPCGTTGESVTLSSDERVLVFRRVAARVGDQAFVIAGTGANATATAIEHQRRARDAGARVSLVVTPYYNKPTAEGLVRHYSALLEAVDLPIVVYNVPGRTGCDLKPDTVGRLASLPGIVGIKEATADLDRVGALRAVTPPSFSVLSGDDGTACAFTLLGGDGVISVTSNVAPKAMGDMIRAARALDVASARALHDRLRPLFGALFLQSNPIPVKAALAMAGKVQEHYRLPLCPMDKGPRAQLAAVLKEGGW